MVIEKDMRGEREEERRKGARRNSDQPAVQRAPDEDYADSPEAISERDDPC
ncbi:MAG TPA: hypothetical protein VMT00_09830 [Thermoanaerobaculia bacterium]|nr:hypothetical protein [Thermoanaerobaculia bacterium]